jgi:hypothetical protein
MESEPRAVIYPLLVQCRVKFDGALRCSSSTVDLKSNCYFFRYVRLP